MKQLKMAKLPGSINPVSRQNDCAINGGVKSDTTFLLHQHATRKSHHGL